MRKLGQGSPAVDSSDCVQPDGARLAVRLLDHDPVVFGPRIGAARPEDVAVLEVHPPLTGPWGDRSFAVPATAVADHDIAREVHRRERHRWPAESAPGWVPGLAVAASPLAGTDES